MGTEAKFRLNRLVILYIYISAVSKFEWHVWQEWIVSSWSFYRSLWRRIIMHFSFLFLYYLKLGENFSYYYCHSNNLRALLVIRWEFWAEWNTNWLDALIVFSSLLPYLLLSLLMQSKVEGLLTIFETNMRIHPSVCINSDVEQILSN